MRKHSLRFIAAAFVFGLAVVFGTAGSASAQSRMTFETDFAFQVGDRKMEAGKYELQKLSAGRYLLRSAKTKEGSLIVSELRTGASSKVEKIVFNRYGEKYFLRKLFAVRGVSGIELAESSAERDVRKNEDKLAANERIPDEVSLTLGQ